MITEDLEEEDADIYWHGVDRAGSASQAPPLVVVVSPGNAASRPWLGWAAVGYLVSLAEGVDEAFGAGPGPDCLGGTRAEERKGQRGEALGNAGGVGRAQ